MTPAEAKFQRIVQHARTTNPFYAEWLAGKDAVPILTRRTLLENTDRILNEHPVTATTSGSTGVPVRISMSPQRQARTVQMHRRFVRWLGGTLVRSQIIYPRGAETDSVLHIKAPIDAQIAFLIRRYETARAVALITYPTNALMLAQAVLESGRDLGFLRRLGLISEAFDPAQRAYIQSAFPNALIWSSYSSMEFGIISAQCPHEPGFQHIMADCFRVEVLDENDRACPPGQVGRIVITDYYNEWCPLIRYEIGDLAVRERCPCGRIGLPAFSAVHGKVRGALKHRSGQRVLFADLSVALRDLPGMKQYQVIQEELERFTVRLVTEAQLEAQVAAAFESHFGYLPTLAFEYHDFLPRDPNGKFHASICRI
jgi:phenylacetate-CoA ligase